ncbi:MAG: hypothetical protein MJ189_01510 [Coriobacteriales bacterium]|nr:hypothetical protein [Coriobacteriales bacterium]
MSNAKAKKSPFIVFGIIFCVVLLLISLSLIGYKVFLELIDGRGVDVILSAQAEDYSDSDCTRFPVKITGSQKNNNKHVNEIQYFNGSGEGVNLKPGDYSFEFPGGPVSQRGYCWTTAYKISGISIPSTLNPVYVYTDLKDQTIKYEKKEIKNLTDKEIKTFKRVSNKDKERVVVYRDILGPSEDQDEDKQGQDEQQKEYFAEITIDLDGWWVSETESDLYNSYNTYMYFEDNICQQIFGDSSRNDFKKENTSVKYCFADHVDSIKGLEDYGPCTILYIDILGRNYFIPDNEESSIYEFYLSPDEENYMLNDESYYTRFTRISDSDSRYVSSLSDATYTYDDALQAIDDQKEVAKQADALLFECDDFYIVNYGLMGDALKFYDYVEQDDMKFYEYAFKGQSKSDPDQDTTYHIGYFVVSNQEISSVILPGDDLESEVIKLAKTSNGDSIYITVTNREIMQTYSLQLTGNADRACTLFQQ